MKTNTKLSAESLDNFENLMPIKKRHYYALPTYTAVSYVLSVNLFDSGTRVSVACATRRS